MPGYKLSCKMCFLCRHNLDPEETLSDNDLWHALEIAQMKLVVSNLDEGLGNQNKKQV